MPDFSIVCECTTKATELDGTRHSDKSEWSEVKAPDNHVINKEKVTVDWIGRNGSENDVDIKYEDWEEIVADTGLEYPRKLLARCEARSPRGHASGRGWSKVRISGDFVKYK
jgi:hypothetical protein